MKNTKQNKIAILTCCEDDWGGSEELWARSIPMLDNATIIVYKKKINITHPEFIRLAGLNVDFFQIEPELSTVGSIARKLTNIVYKATSSKAILDYSVRRFHESIMKSKPDLVLIAQGINFDGLKFAYRCLLLNIPYVIIAQKAVEFYWPYPSDREYMKETLLKAQQCFFVSAHNKTLTEEQFGIRLPNSIIIHNPIKTTVKCLPFPSHNNGYKLACVARLFIIDKAQDILLRIMSKEKWKSRPLTISFIGNGHDEQGLKEMAALLAVENVLFEGFYKNIEEVWKNFHALVLPSRSEGLPLSMLEAMAMGRPVIVSNAGGNADVIQEGYNGFISEATENDFESALDRAWDRRNDWENIGQNAFQSILKYFPSTPETDFANHINNIIHEI